MSTNLSDTQESSPESGILPGRYEWVPEPTPGEKPTDPDFQLFSDALRSFEAEVGASYGAQNVVAEVDPLDHNRGTEDPSSSVAYDLQRFPVDDSDDPQDPSGYGAVRTDENQLHATLLIVGRREYPGGVNDTGVREYTVIRGAAVESVEPTLDPSSEQPILMELDMQPRRVRSYKIDQPPDEATTLDVVSSDDADSMDVTIESEDASTTDTITLNGTTAVTGAESFSDVDAVWLSDAPAGDVTISDGSGNTLVDISGGLTYSDDDQPVDGDRGVPTLGSGSRGTKLGTSYEHFLGDRFERPAGSGVAPRVNSASWTVENEIETSSLHDSRSPAVDVGNRTVSADVDIGGQFMTHNTMREALEKTQAALEHELSGGVVTLNNTVVESPPTRSVESEQAVASEGITLGASGSPAITFSAN
jgi:hypothetical protein